MRTREIRGVLVPPFFEGVVKIPIRVGRDPSTRDHLGLATRVLVTYHSHCSSTSRSSCFVDHIVRGALELDLSIAVVKPFYSILVIR